MLLAVVLVTVKIIYIAKHSKIVVPTSSPHNAIHPTLLPVQTMLYLGLRKQVEGENSVGKERNSYCYHNLVWFLPMLQPKEYVLESMKLICMLSKQIKAMSSC